MQRGATAAGLRNRFSSRYGHPYCYCRPLDYACLSSPLFSLPSRFLHRRSVCLLCRPRRPYACILLSSVLLRPVSYLSFCPRSGALVAPQTDAEKMTALLSNQCHSMVTFGQISFETATLMPPASGRSPGGADRHGPNHTYTGALCVELSEITSGIRIGVAGRAAAIARPRPATKLFREVYHQVGSWVKFVFLLCCKR